MKYGHRFHWRQHCSQSRDGSPPFEGATVVRSLLPEAALNIRRYRQPESNYLFTNFGWPDPESSGAINKSMCSLHYHLRRLQARLIIYLTDEIFGCSRNDRLGRKL